MIYAGFWRRLVAYLIDGVVLNVAGFFGFVVLFAMIPELPQWAVTLISHIAVWLYFAFLESSISQATLGKRALGLRVTDEKGQCIGFGRATVRHFGRFLNAFSFGIGYLSIAFEPRKQGFHDMVARTVVLRTAPAAPATTPIPAGSTPTL